MSKGQAAAPDALTAHGLSHGAPPPPPPPPPSSSSPPPLVGAIPTLATQNDTSYPDPYQLTPYHNSSYHNSSSSHHNSSLSHHNSSSSHHNSSNHGATLSSGIPPMHQPSHSLAGLNMPPLSLPSPNALPQIPFYASPGPTPSRQATYSAAQAAHPQSPSYPVASSEFYHTQSSGASFHPQFSPGWSSTPLHGRTPRSFGKQNIADVDQFLVQPSPTLDVSGSISHAASALARRPLDLGMYHDRDHEVSTEDDDDEPGDDEASFAGNSRKRKSASQKNDRSEKGLRHFSQLVCRKVEDKGTTSYNEVADELVVELSAKPHQIAGLSVDQKNIRRRVYDALNVLMAINVISKKKKEIKWRGLSADLPMTSEVLLKEISARRQRIQQKKDNLNEITAQYYCWTNLLERNNRPQFARTLARDKVPLPFILVRTGKETVIDCEISEDKKICLF
eukprot:TRINITY_DN7084_c0_g1_i2.p1 TRINITY_DN7084_c0_g1~~TRINITY_DN7084_c0_g1_i2.p1  ORF type:complete len:478 (+),score=77.08 TRINITY_DN7084_c0_g1_i2:89-1435(+)